MKTFPFEKLYKAKLFCVENNVSCLFLDHNSPSLLPYLYKSWQGGKLITSNFFIVIDHTPPITQGANRRGTRCCFTHGQNIFHTIIVEPFIFITLYFVRQSQFSSSILTYSSSFIHRLCWLNQNTKM